MASSLLGSTWVTIDDKTNKPRAEVLFEEENGVVSGQIMRVYPQPEDTGICSQCPGEFKDKSITGIRFVWGLKQTNDKNWNGGEILDPKTGKIYRVKMLLKGDRLFVRAYLGVSVLGRTQLWERKKV